MPLVELLVHESTTLPRKAEKEVYVRRLAWLGTPGRQYWWHVNVFASCSGLGWDSWDLRRMMHQFSRGRGCVS